MIGIVSVILWSLVLIVSLKYAILVMRADVVHHHRRARPRRRARHPARPEPLLCTRKRLFAAMHLNTNLPAAYYGVPTGQVVEVGLEVEI